MTLRTLLHKPAMSFIKILPTDQKRNSTIPYACLRIFQALKVPMPLNKFREYAIREAVDGSHQDADP